MNQDKLDNGLVNKFHGFVASAQGLMFTTLKSNAYSVFNAIIFIFCAFATVAFFNWCGDFFGITTVDKIPAVGQFLDNYGG